MRHAGRLWPYWQVAEVSSKGLLLGLELLKEGSARASTPGLDRRLASWRQQRRVDAEVSLDGGERSAGRRLARPWRDVPRADGLRGTSN